MIYLFMVLGVVAAFLSRGNKRWLCGLYVGALVLEVAVTGLYRHYGILDEYWKNYYFAIAMIDLVTLALMTYCYHKHYRLVYPALFLMVVLNATIGPEFILMKSSFIWSISEDALHVLNFAILTIFFGGSDGFIRLSSKLWTRLLGNSREFAPDILRIFARKGSLKDTER